MRLRNILSAVLACLMAFNGLIGYTLGAETKGSVSQAETQHEVLWSSGRFSMAVAANKFKKGNVSFSLAAGECVTINATCLPAWADVDFGLVDAEGMFYYVNVTGGFIDQAIEIEENGTYTLAVRNNLSTVIDVTGVVGCWFR